MKTVIFDLDGTIADTSKDLLNAANSCFESLGYKKVLSQTEHYTTAFSGGRALLRTGFDLIGHEYNEDKISQHYLTFLQDYERNISIYSVLYPEVRNAVNQLKNKGFCVGICTNKPEFLAEKLMANLNFREEFGSLIGADTLPVRKPDPAPLIEAIKRCGGSLSEALLVGDTVTDFKTARAAGIPIILVEFENSQDLRHLKADAYLTDYKDLLAVSKSILS